MAARKCRHGHVKSICAACIDDRNHGAGSGRRSTVYRQAAWQKKVEWWKAKARRQAKETEYTRRYLGGHSGERSA